MTTASQEIRKSIEDRGQRLDKAYSQLESSSKLKGVDVKRRNAVCEFNPAAGEVMRPECVELKLPVEDDEAALMAISKACDEYGLKVIVPDFKQPDFGYTSGGEYREPNQDVSYETLVRLVDDA